MAFGKFVATNLVLILCLFAVLSVAAPRKGLSRKVLRAGNEIGSSTISKITLPSSSALRKARSSGATNVRPSRFSERIATTTTTTSGQCDFCQFCNSWDDDMKYKNFATEEECQSRECDCENLESETVSASLNKTSVCIFPVVPKLKNKQAGQPYTDAEKAKTFLCLDTSALVKPSTGKGNPVSCKMSICRGASDGQKSTCHFTELADKCFFKDADSDEVMDTVCFNREIHSTVWKEDWWRVFKVTWEDTGCNGELDTFISIPHSDRLFKNNECTIGDAVAWTPDTATTSDA